MDFGSDRDQEARIGRVCLVYARVEHEAGQVVQAAFGDWDAAGSTDYLETAGTWGLLLKMLKAVGEDHEDLKPEVRTLCDGLWALKNYRDTLAHSAAITDIFLLLGEKGTTSFTPGGRGRLLNARTRKHLDAPTEAEVEAFCDKASVIGDGAQALALKLAQRT